MDWISIITTITTIICGGGWFINYRAKKMQAEADGWRAQQDVYQRTIEDLKQSCDYIRNDRNVLREENKKLTEENNALREKYNDMEKQIDELRKMITRQESRLESILPFACSVAICPNRKRIDVVENEKEDS